MWLAKYFLNQIKLADTESTVLQYLDPTLW